MVRLKWQASLANTEGMFDLTQYIFTLFQYLNPIPQDVSMKHLLQAATMEQLLPNNTKQYCCTFL